MSYTPTEWTSGDVITAEKLNKLEGGVAESGAGSDNGPLFVRFLENDAWRLDASFNQVKDAVDAGRAVILETSTDGNSYVYHTFIGLQMNYYDGGSCSCDVTFNGSIFSASDPDEPLVMPD